ncbi:MAG: sugar ABC transporter ATP-binding protein [Trueperaceae bacterium]|nr:sugar ABC transporter ATP-binding protein [Trueperaceae bacterium]
MTSLLSVKNACKSYNGNQVLDHVWLELASAEVHALMGENGAGKSTLIKLLAGVVSPDRLELTLKGSPVQIRSAKEAFALGLRFIHQELSVVPQLSVAENLFLQLPYPKRFGLVNWQRLNEKARTMLAGLGIEHIPPGRKMARLSTGDKMLIKIAAALLGEASASASVFVLDEPTAALSSEESGRLFKLIEQLKQRGCAVLYVSHRLEEIFALCDRVTVMRDGKTVASKKLAETGQNELISLMTGRSLGQIYGKREKELNQELLLKVTRLENKKLKGINFQLLKGEILGLAGLAGSGRSELLRALMGVDSSSHDIALAGQRFVAHSPTVSWEQGLAFVPEERRTEGLVLSHSVEKNIALPHLAQLSGAGVLLNRSVQGKKARALSQMVNLKARNVGQKTKELSGGNQQKVVFARALAASPRLLLLDEPGRGVDVGAKGDIYSFIRTLSSKGTGIIMASSDLAELLGLCDRILILHEGRQIALVKAQGLSQADLLSLCYQTEVAA